MGRMEELFRIKYVLSFVNLIDRLAENDYLVSENLRLTPKSCTVVG